MPDKTIPKTEQVLDVVVIGGGAAGFFGAIAFAEARPIARITILEKGREILAKVRISGGGRCNLTNACFDPKALIANYPRGGKALLGPFHKFQPKNTIEWFEAHGVPLKTEPDGRVFPASDLSKTVIDGLTTAASRSGIEVQTGVIIDSVADDADGFRINMKNGKHLRSRHLLLATGSSAEGWRWASDLGHTVEPAVPSLFTFTIAGERLKGLAGISVEKARVGLSGTKLVQPGAVLVTHWGLSGPATLKLSAWGARILHEMNYRALIAVNWVDQETEDVLKTLTEEKAVNPRRTPGAHPCFGLPKRLWERLVELSGIMESARWADLSSDDFRRLAKELSAGEFQMNGKSAFKEEFVTCGGVRLDEVDFRTMESRVRPGLYFAGEVLDIDGVTGGFNFQSAWTTGWLAGRAMAEKAFSAVRP